MQSMYPEFPPPQLYILLAISTTLLGIAVSYLSSSKQNLKGTDILFLLAWLHVTISVMDVAFREGGEGLWGYVIPHLLILVSFIYSLTRIVRMAKGRAKEDALS